MKQIALLLLGLLIFGCKSNAPLNQKKNSDAYVEKIKWKQIDLALNQLIAHDIQENLTLQDELLLTYSLRVVEKDSVLKVLQASQYIGHAKKGQVFNLDSMDKLQVVIKEGQSLGISLALWEIDDYSKSQKLLKKLSLVSGSLQLPMTLVEWSSANNPVGWFLWATRLSSFGVDFLASMDKDDLLGKQEVTWSWDELSLRNRPRIYRVQWKGKDSVMNTFRYEFSYEINSKDVVK